MGISDVLGGIELTVSCAILIAAISIAVGSNVPQRIVYSILLGGWFVVVVIVAATGALLKLGTPGVGIMAAVPMALMIGAAVRGSRLRANINHAPLVVLVAINVVRVLGVNFLILQANNRLPAPFAPVAGWGDIVAGLAAVPVAWQVLRRGAGWQAWLTAWNAFGLADLVAALALGTLSSPGPTRMLFAPPGSGLMSTLPWLLIPGFIVPLLAMTHLTIFYRLAKRKFDPPLSKDNPVGSKMVAGLQ